MKKTFHFIILTFLGLGFWINCSTTPTSIKNVYQENIDLQGKNVVSIVVPHLTDPKEIAAFNAGIFSAVGSEKIVPTVPEALKGTLNSIFSDAAKGSLGDTVMSEYVALATKIVDPDYVFLVSTNNTTIIHKILFVPRAMPGIEVNVILWDVKNKKLLGTAKYYGNLPDNPQIRLGSLTNSGKNAIQFLVQN
jgi:hypothetical protein